MFAEASAHWLLIAEVSALSQLWVELCRFDKKAGGVRPDDATCVFCELEARLVRVPVKPEGDAGFLPQAWCSCGTMAAESWSVKKRTAMLH